VTNAAAPPQNPESDPISPTLIPKTTMERKEFLKQACALGLCSCTVASLFASAVVQAADEPKPAPKPEAKPEDWRIGFAQQRYAKLLSVLAAKVDEPTLNAALQEVGRFCGSTVKFVVPYAGNPEGFLAEIRKQWPVTVDYDAVKGVVSLAFPATGECPCALVRKGVTPAVVCQCSLGWQKQVFGIVFGRPVEVELKESLLRGDPRCAFVIRARPA
jgi:hypothetical protein